MKLKDTTHQKILISPLNWGMGHVSRCIGLVRQLLAQQNEVIIACDDRQRKIFESYFPGMEFIHHDGYPFEFSGNGNFASDLFNNRTKLFPRFAREQKEIGAILQEHNIDLIIADQRYGFFSKKVPSVFVTHQLHLPLKWYQFPAQWINKSLIRNFAAIWCLDTENHALAGKLSQPIAKVPTDYIGFFSRFESVGGHAEAYEKLFVISGPEPYAEQFFNAVLKHCEGRSEGMACLVPEKYPQQIAVPNLDVIVASDWKTDDLLFHQSKTVVSRAGYSTLMDLKILEKDAILIPTPGQAEQIYLAQLHQGHPRWTFQKQL